MNVKLDIIISTFNREEQLKDCIASLIAQDCHQPTGWGVIIVNNYDKDFGQETLDFLSRLERTEIIKEENIGLSHARNTGVGRSRAEWLGFLDDDAKVPTDYVNKAMEIINGESFDCFGGHIKSWWKYSRPAWLDESFGSKPILLTKRGLLDDGYNWGSNIFIRKSALLNVQLFPLNIGMKGGHLGYAAENIVQKELRKKKYRIGYDPEFYIDHLVMPHKLKLWWHIKASFAAGRDGRKVFTDQYSLTGYLRSFKNCFSRPVKAIFRFLVEKNYSWQNAYLDAGKPVAHFIGKVYSIKS